MSEFNKWQEYKALSDSEFYIAKESWDYQQAKIDDSENTRAVLYRENIDIREKNTDLQAKIDELKAKNEKTQKQFNFLLDKNIRDESAHATLKLKFMEVSRLVRSLRSEFDLWSDSPPVERQIELLEEIMRGGHE